MSDVQALLERFVEDPDEASDEELAQLVRLCEESPEFAQTIRGQLMLGELLQQRFTVDRQNFLAQIDQRVRDFHVGEEELTRQVLELRTIARNDDSAPPPSRTGLWFLMALASCVLLAVGIGLVATAERSDVLATVRSVEGEPIVVYGANERPATVGRKLRQGDRLTTASGENIELAYADGTFVRIGEATKVELMRDSRTGGKLVMLDSGELSASIESQPAASPMVFNTPTARATVLGTELHLQVDATTTRLDVSEGRVRLERFRDQQAKAVASNEIATVSAAHFDVAPLSWPTQPKDLTFLILSGQRAAFVRSVATNKLRIAPWTQRGAAQQDGQGTVHLRGGSLGADDAGADLVAPFASGRDFSVEIMFARDAKNGVERRELLSLGRNGTLFEEAGELRLALRTSATPSEADPAPVTLAKLGPSGMHHLVATFRTGKLAAWLDGEPSLPPTAIAGDLSTWTAEPLRLGGTPELPWQGTITALAIYARPLDELEARRNATLCRSIHAALSAESEDEKSE